MNLQSMTGFGRAEAEQSTGNYKIEIKTVNNRFLDVQFRMPRICNPLEKQIRDYLSSRLTRGSVSFNINREATGDDVIVKYDPELAEKYVNVIKSLANDFDLAGEPSVNDLSPFLREFVSQELAEFTDEQLWADLEPVLVSAVDQLVEVREKEGDFIRNGLLELLAVIENGLEEIKKYAPTRLEKVRERLSKVVEDLKGEGVDESRIAFETSIMADKLDIAEEILRLSAHIVAMKDLLSGEGEVGKRLNFLLQEMNREINTIGSKANDSEISRLVVDCKEATERIREQALNLV